MKKNQISIISVSVFFLLSALFSSLHFGPEANAEKSEEFSACENAAMLDGVSELLVSRSGAVNVTVTKRGFESDVTMNITVNDEGKIEQISVLEADETPALGGKVLEDGFLSQFTGLDDFSGIDTITGATHTFDAVCECAETAVRQFRSYNGIPFDADATDADLFLKAAGEYLGESCKPVEIEKTEQFVEAVCSGENGWAVYVSGNGYYEDQMIKLAVMLDPDGKISGITVISQHETGDNGDQVFKESYLNFFKGGKKFSLFEIGDGSTVVNAYSGATASSFGLCRLINAASAQVESLIETAS